jgi:hypothetical protein
MDDAKLMVGMVALLVGACGSGADTGTGTKAPDERAESGQTGSVICGRRISAACSMLTDHVIVEVEALEVDPETSIGTFEVVASVNPSPSFDDDDVGTTIVGPYSTFWPADARHIEGDWSLVQAPLAVGDHLLASFWQAEYRKLHCPGFTACSEACESWFNHEGEDEATYYATRDACYDDCAESCVPTRSTEPLSLALWVIPLAETYDFAGEILSVDDLRALSVTSACFELFPAPETPPCNDTGEAP